MGSEDLRMGETDPVAGIPLLNVECPLLREGIVHPLAGLELLPFAAGDWVHLISELAVFGSEWVDVEFARRRLPAELTKALNELLLILRGDVLCTKEYDSSLGNQCGEVTEEILAVGCVEKVNELDRTAGELGAGRDGSVDVGVAEKLAFGCNFERRGKGVNGTR